VVLVYACHREYGNHSLTLISSYSLLLHTKEIHSIKHFRHKAAKKIKTTDSPYRQKPNYPLQQGLNSVYPYNWKSFSVRVLQGEVEENISDALYQFALQYSIMSDW